jgi:YegS/Rv2252/BmrU family lipid kinase
MPKTLIILNPHAGSGLAGRIWSEIEPTMREQLGELVVAVTQNPEEVSFNLEQAYANDVTRVVSIGGDGTNHVVVNALVDLHKRFPDKPPLIYGNVPIGTGRDWARGIGIPTESHQASIEWIAKAKPRSIDLGVVSSNGKQEYFLNIASAGMGGEVASRVNNARVRRPWTFLQATVATILNYKPQPVQIILDGKAWYDDRAYAIVVANGKFFGHGMKIAPDALYDDGLFNVLVIDDAPRVTILGALRRVYNGSHMTHPVVHHALAKKVEVHSPTGETGMELDGEYTAGQDITFEVAPAALHVMA